MNDLILRDIEGEPRALDVDIGIRLGMAQPLNIRQTIEKHRDELEQFGLVHAVREPYVSGKGKVEETTAYHLNEEQALTLAQISRAPRAKDVRAMLVRVFVAYRRGQLGVSPEALSNVLRHMVDDLIVARLASDPRIGAIMGVSQRQMLDRARAPSKGRTPLNRKFGYHLPRYAIAKGVLPKICPHSGVLLYPVEMADQFMRELGAAWVADHLRRLGAQGVLSFPTSKNRKVA